MATTAEGVETEAERQLVRELGCSELQGYLVGRPERRETPAVADVVEVEVEADAPVTPLKVPPVRRRRSRAA
jgi:EAL domain-containing protein (putative c-di-GMP-specific phosphodiesterase class I)